MHLVILFGERSQGTIYLPRHPSQSTIEFDIGTHREKGYIVYALQLQHTEWANQIPNLSSLCHVPLSFSNKTKLTPIQSKILWNRENCCFKETGLILMEEPETKFQLESPGGRILVQADCKNSKVVKVTLQSMPAFVAYCDKMVTFVEN